MKQRDLGKLPDPHWEPYTFFTLKTILQIFSKGINNLKSKTEEKVLKNYSMQIAQKTQLKLRLSRGSIYGLEFSNIVTSSSLLICVSGYGQ
jgi:hypothetical protein